ncbi:MAG: magnesium transporter [Deltaproteobacteria bacterium]|nr:magnesium transporter [Deltaproteobacteria bacterium]
MLGQLLKPEYEELIHARNWDALRDAFADLEPPDVAELLETVSPQDSAVVFRLLPRDQAADTFEHLPLDRQTRLIEVMAEGQLGSLLEEMAPDDRTRLLEELPWRVTQRLLNTLSPEERRIAGALLGYPERSAGRYMTPEYVSFREDMTVAEALAHVRRHGKDRETLNVVYVVDRAGCPVLAVRLATLVLADPQARVMDLDHGMLVSIPATAPREDVVAAFEKYDREVLPVTDSRGALVGIITVDDVLDVQAEEATEDIHKLGGMEALEEPYLTADILTMVRKRGTWLALLLVGEMLTATAMAFFEHDIARAVVLTLFIPMIISSGGNSGSQATSLIIRALAVREVELPDWWRVCRREALSGLILGAFLGLIGFVRIAFWPTAAAVYGPHYRQVALVVALSLVGVVMFGTLAGSMLPFLLRRLKLDPATASAPFVATLVDVTGLLIYFTLASVILKGTLL